MGNNWAVAVFATMVPIGLLLLTALIRLAFVLGTLKRTINDMQKDHLRVLESIAQHITDPFPHPIMWKQFPHTKDRA